MSWNNSLYTNVGTKMMSEVLSGATMTITKAVGGSGTTAAESLAALTDVKEQKQTLKILGIEDATDSSDDDVGKRIKIQITNGDLETGYILHQVGIYAKLADGDETLLIIMQDDRGVEIPSHTENSDFSIELYGIMAISNLANISVTVDPNAVASVKMVNQQIAQVNTKIDKTKEDLQKEAQQTYLPLTGGTLTGPIIMPGGGSALSIEDNAATHNMVYRGKALGGSVTSEQWAAIKAGTFKDLYLGDYWSIGGVDYLIAAFNYWLTCGDTACNTNHLLVVPRNNLYTAGMNSSNITTGGYVGSEMYKTGLAQAKTTINNAFGSAHILNHRQYLVNAVTNGAPTGTDWFDSTVELMNENMVYGGRQFSPMPNGATDPWNTCRNYTIDKSQLPLFRLAPWLICNRQWYWLRDIVSAAAFAGVSGHGDADCYDASLAGGVRPVVGLIG
nr:MAG TPA: tail-collar fiber protein [Caudoviricetes sp.]